MKKKKMSAGKAGCLVFIILFLAAGVGIFRMITARQSLPEKFALVVTLSGELKETADPQPPLPLLPDTRSLSLQDLIFLLEDAGKDERVTQVVLDIDAIRFASAQIRQLQEAIQRTSASGTPVTGFLHAAGDQDLWLASACDTLIAERGNQFLLDGLRAEMLFYAGTLEKIGVSFQAAQWKAWKSGIEPYTRENASPEYLEQIGTMLDGIYDDYTAYVSQQRGISQEAYKNIIDEKTVVSAEQAQQLRLVDRVSGFWEYTENLKRELAPDGLEDSGDELLVGAKRYMNAVTWPYKPGTKDGIAVITISGVIVQSAGDMPGGTEPGSDEQSLREALDAALDEESVKAIVLRIDSPGGDALASANMLQMLDSANVQKPIVASMSGVAASGGYMAALAADSIFADPLTVTGSIGVYALKPNIQGLQEKIGLRREVVTRGKNADAYTLFKPLDEDGFAKFMETTGWIYDDFINKVAEHRDMKPEEVDAVAGGRIW
ncbi:MAG: S49 family peptidase, partial [Prosthecochloris sp.]|uniref:S49 family peptidase n=1 Tax=Prosthecochloris sp. TaxID=290513 RepID=UPI00258C597F